MISTIYLKLRNEGCRAQPYMGSLLALSRFPSGNNISEDLYHLYHRIESIIVSLYHPLVEVHIISQKHCFGLWLQGFMA